MARALCTVPFEITKSTGQKIRIACKAMFLAWMLVASAMAQNHLRPDTPVSAYSPTFDVGFGYSFLSSSVPTGGQVQFNGLNANARANFLPHWGVTIDAGYARNSDVLNTGHPGYIMTFLGGPVFYPVAHGKTRPFLHALIGAGLVDGAVPLNDNTYLHGWVERPAYAFGGGIEHSVMGPFSLRGTGDYLRTAYADSVSTVRAQNSIRVTASILFRLNYHANRE